MFVSRLKRQYLAYFLFVLSIRISSIIENFQAHNFTRGVFSVVMVFVFAFLLYFVGVCIGMFIKRIRIIVVNSGNMFTRRDRDPKR